MRKNPLSAVGLVFFALNWCWQCVCTYQRGAHFIYFNFLKYVKTKILAIENKTK